MSYSNGIQITYLFSAFAGVSAAGQSSEKIAGPDGKTGRLVSMLAIVTTANTGAAGIITLRNNVTTSELYGTLSVPVAVAELVANDFAIDDVADSATETSIIPDGAVLELDGDGTGTSGIVDVYVTIEWS